MTLASAAGERRVIAEDGHLKLNATKHGLSRMVEARTSVMRLLVDAPQSPELTLALLEAVQAGPQRDSLGPVRAVAIAGLASPAANDEPGVRASIRHTAGKGDTDVERKAAKAILEQIGEA